MANGAEGDPWSGASGEAIRIGVLERDFRIFQNNFGEFQRDIGQRFEAQQRDTARGLETLAANLGAKIDQQARKPTNINAIITTGVTVAGFVLAFVGTIGIMAISPIRDTVAENKVDIRETDRSAVKIIAFNEWASEQQKRNLWVSGQLDEMRRDYVSVAVLGEVEKLMDERHANYLRDLADVKTALRDVEGSLIKRPEIEAANRSQDQRADALSSRLNNLQQTLETIFPANEVIKELQTRLNQLTFSMPTAPATH